ncbi:hypothetical protein SBADM41S_02682 [Streptomyces badius]
MSAAASATVPGVRLGSKSYACCAALLLVYVAMATLPATAAMTAATAGAVRPRLRAASRRAIRGVSGSRRPSRPRKPTITGMQPSTPSSARTEPPATKAVSPATPP